MKPLKILQVHNAYQQRGGEDMVAESEREMLVADGHEVRTYLRDNRDLQLQSKFGLMRRTLWSDVTVHDMQALFAEWRPDVIHAHNTFPQVSPSLYWAASRAGVPVVQTLHNFRLLCSQAGFLRDGKLCERCLGKLPLEGVVHGCYRGSRVQTTVLTAMVSLHRGLGTWQHKVTRYIALNRFCRQRFIDGGLPADRIAIKPNFVAPPQLLPNPQPRSGILFVGRLSEEKGIDVLGKAAALVPEVNITVLGDGPMRSALPVLPNLHLQGAVDVPTVLQAMQGALALVIPSICLESFPRTLVEAYACGLPAVATRLGALPDLVQEGKTGLLTAPGDARELASVLRWVHQHSAEMTHMGKQAQALYACEFMPHTNLQQLLQIYQDAIHVTRSEAKAPQFEV